MNHKITPLHDRVIVEPLPIENKTSGGIIIPDTAKEKPVMGTVIAVGVGNPNEPMTVKENDIVMYNKHAGVSVEVSGKACLIMKENEILAIV